MTVTASFPLERFLARAKPCGDEEERIEDVWGRALEEKGEQEVMETLVLHDDDVGPAPTEPRDAKASAMSSWTEEGQPSSIAHFNIFK